MARVTRALFFIALLLCSTLASAARPEPAFSAQADIEQSCEGVGEEECLMRRVKQIVKELSLNASQEEGL
ncbi:hypothetical protein RchiOBHm_Chr2g0124661 [Rosa chinensis]|uniref:Phytosulfokine-beta n=1 Tax=Rosa chinensis TaxID=74649 RepID=A0A2P6RTF1_ROSCH|nr:hypothetical protein RchiOBHm_Chr2g0124661 [Rosa chinensis]